jgi:quercetin dioxygenase-like cupin family protein
MRGVFGRGASFTVVELDPGAELPMHSHPHEQIGLVLEGVQILLIDGREHHLRPQQAYTIPGGVEHGGRGGPEGCVAVDIFVPTREDYRSAQVPEIAASVLAPGVDDT